MDTVKIHVGRIRAKVRSSNGVDLVVKALQLGFVSLSDLPAPRLHGRPLLTARKEEIVSLIAQGYTNEVVARSLGITLHTVKTHVQEIQDEFGARNRVDSVVKALQFGLVSLDDLPAPVRNSLALLTAREEDVLSLLRLGHASAEVSRQLDLTLGHVRQVEQSIRRKWGVTRRADVLALASARPVHSPQRSEGRVDAATVSAPRTKPSSGTQPYASQAAHTHLGRRDDTDPER
jgi:DNA-binding CsgD family transcriptional regulator